MHMKLIFPGANGLMMLYFTFPARTVQTKFDASTLHSNPAIARETGMVDDGTGTKMVKCQFRFS